MKRLDELEINEIFSFYSNFFKDFGIDSIIVRLFEKYSKLLEEFTVKCEMGYKIKYGTMGRGEIKWGRNIVYGWFFEEIIFEILKMNPNIKQISFYGGDMSKNFIYESSSLKIDIPGIKSSKPDLKIELNSGEILCIEIKTAAKDIYSIKNSNVESLYREFAENNVLSLIIMFDLNSNLYSIENMYYFMNLTPFVNKRMEGQLCYVFTKPSTPVKNLINEDFKNLVLLSEKLNTESLKKLKAENIAKSTGNKKTLSLIKAKISVEKKLENFKQLQIQVKSEIEKIKSKNPEIDTPWSEIYKKLDI